MTSLALLEQQCSALGLDGRHVVFHSSGRSLGELEGGIDGLLSVLVRRLATVIAPGFTFASTIHPPDGDHPPQNGFDYGRRWISPSTPFEARTASIDPRMGILPRRLFARPEARRSTHPWHSWIAAGEAADEITAPHPWDWPHRPLEEVEKRDGLVALVGTGLDTCTALHLSEQRAGRHPFIRWAVDAGGTTRRVRVGGCGNGFRALDADLLPLFRTGKLGEADVWVAPLRPLLDAGTRCFIEKPLATLCQPSCIKCLDGAAGGPPDSA